MVVFVNGFEFRGFGENLVLKYLEISCYFEISRWRKISAKHVARSQLPLGKKTGSLAPAQICAPPSAHGLNPLVKVSSVKIHSVMIAWLGMSTYMAHRWRESYAAGEFIFDIIDDPAP